MSDIHTLQEAAVILKQARIDVAAGSLAVWRKVDSALRYINSQIEVELAEEVLVVLGVDDDNAGMPVEYQSYHVSGDWDGEGL